MKDIFGERLFPAYAGGKKPTLFFCELCECLCMVCEHCKNTSCNGSGCEKCLPIHKKFAAIENGFIHKLKELLGEN